MRIKKQRTKLNSKELSLFAAPLLVLACLLAGSKAKQFWGSRPNQSTNLSPAPVKPPEYRGINSVSVSPEGLKLATGSSDGYVQVWNIQTGALHQILRRKGKRINAVAYSPNGRILAGASGDSLFLWSVPSGQLLKVFRVSQPSISSISFSPNSEQVAVGCGTGGLYRGSGTIHVWRVKTGQSKAVLRGNVAYVGSVAFSPDGKSLAASCGMNRGTASKPNPIDLVRLWNLKTKALVWEARGGYVEGNVGFSGNGKLVVNGGHDPLFLFAQSGKSAAPAPPAREGSAWQVAFSPDGRSLASGGYGSPIVFWDTSTGREIDPGQGLDHYSTHSLVFSRDGKRLVSGSGDSEGIVKIWDVSQLNQRKQFASPNLPSHLQLLLTIDTVTRRVVVAKKP